MPFIIHLKNLGLCLELNKTNNIPIQLRKVYQGQQIIHQFVGGDLRKKLKHQKHLKEKITVEAFKTPRMHYFRQVGSNFCAKV